MKNINFPQISDFPQDFHNFYKIQKKKLLPNNCKELCLFIPEEYVDGKKTIFSEYIKKQGSKIPDEVHYSRQGLGFVEIKKKEFPFDDINKFKDFKFYFDENYKNRFNTCELRYCIIRAKELNQYMQKTFETNKEILKYKSNKKKSIIGKTSDGNDIEVYFVRSG